LHTTSPDNEPESNRREQPLLVFFHLRKTAGLTVRFVMARQFRRDEIITLDDSPTVEEANRIWNTLPAQRRAQINAYKAICLSLRTFLRRGRLPASQFCGIP
jgi:hypothetical protein